MNFGGVAAIPKDLAEQIDRKEKITFLNKAVRPHGLHQTALFDDAVLFPDQRLYQKSAFGGL